MNPLKQQEFFSPFFFVVSERFPIFASDKHEMLNPSRMFCLFLTTIII